MEVGTLIVDFPVHTADRKSGLPPIQRTLGLTRQCALLSFQLGLRFPEVLEVLYHRAIGELCETLDTDIDTYVPCRDRFFVGCELDIEACVPVVAVFPNGAGSYLAHNLAVHLDLAVPDPG
jgi:hypothetical protein